jgi:predicted metalloprotease with PDZ domain
MNMPATFMWARGLEDAPIRITFHRFDPDWKIATQLIPTGNPDVFTAPGLAYFLDSPTELSAFTMRDWTVAGNGKTYTIRLALHHDGTEAEADAFAEMAEKVAAEQIAVFGGPPDYEPGTYTFIADYLPYVDGDGMEHRNSTVLTSTRPLATGALRNLGTVSHEFFHQWNVERIRPRTLEPFDFEAANMSDALWFAEGFTSYYTGLMIRRAGLTDDSTYAESLSGTVSTVVNAPGRRFFSPAEMSQRAPFVDAATSVDPRNLENTFISYYTWGSAIGLALDLTLRSRYDGRTLDGFMRAMWEQYGKPERPYVLDDLQRTLGAYTGDPAFAANFFARFIRGREVADYETLLGEAGFLLRKAHPGRAWLGVSLEERDGEAVVASRALAGSPAYEAGLEEGDVILRFDQVEVTHPAHVEALMQVTPPGTALAITYRQRGRVREATLMLTEDLALEVVPYETVGRTLTPDAQALRGDWLKARR